MLSNHNTVPVIMFHSVGLENENWVFSHISEPVNVFEEKIAYLAKKRYNFIFWDDLYDHMSGRRKLPRKSIMLTFDDGYLDNWVYAFPILKKYGAKATIFVNPEFVDPRPVVRNWADTIKDDRNASIEKKGFLSWDELRLMQQSGLIDVQSHSLTHTWYFCGKEVIDFYSPSTGNKYPWLFWNARPDRKPFYMVEDQSSFIPLGHPIYIHEKALIAKRFLPSERLVQELSSLVLNEEVPHFFENKDWFEKLVKVHEMLIEKYGFEVESEEDYKKRVYQELSESKRIIETHLDKEVKYICWPGGGYNDITKAIAREVGYKAWTLSSKDLGNKRNRPGAEPSEIKRIGSLSRYRFGGRDYGYASAKFFYFGVQEHKGSFICKFINRLLVLWVVITRTIHAK